ncbi:hypothetical protein CLOM_g23372 [Closterium sp. NIES-68]|nr:hypothetical protein CLOM_g23372 [Closterium sp. NIES-68]GJP71599.1 hypothetical protein CLOP_g2417 [Closterium sp. NIES-67]
MAAPREVFVIGTMDTKADELLFLASQLKHSLTSLSSLNSPHPLPHPPEPPFSIVLVDVSASPTSSPPATSTPLSTITVADLLASDSGATAKSAASLAADRGEAVQAVSDALKRFVRGKWEGGALAGAVGIGGSGGTAIIAPALRALPVGAPKMIVSTVASGNTAPYIDTSDLVLVPSIVDVAGLNAILRAVLSSTAAALAGMLTAWAALPTQQASVAAPAASPAGCAPVTVGVTMFGVTTPCVTEVQHLLTSKGGTGGEGGAEGLEVVVFHATGTGGRAMEENVASGLIQAVLDITTTEVADFIVGGTMPCLPSRFDAAIQKQVPLVLSLGALDMVNFGAASSVPKEFEGRKLHVHNPQVTLMRTTADESRRIARFIAGKMNQSQASVTLLIPEGGLSALDAPGMPFWDPEADAALFEELEKEVQHTESRTVVRLPHHINDPEFAAAVVSTLLPLPPSLSPPPPAAVPPAAAPPAADPSASDARPPHPSEPAPAITPTPAPSTALHPSVPLSSTLDLPPALDLSPIPWLVSRRTAILHSLRAQVVAGRAIIGGGAGTGISAKCEEMGGVDLIVIYNSGRFRMAGRGSLAGLLPFADANAVVVDMAKEVLPVVKSVPVLAGVCATDPFRQMPLFLRHLAALGFAGVQNFPTVGLYDGSFRTNLEETGMGYPLEVAMIKAANSLGFLTTPYAFNEGEARAMAGAGADVVVAHMGLTAAGSIGARTVCSLEEAVGRVQRMADAARAVKPDVLVLCHGGPISGPEEARYILEHTRGVHGFYGASSMERLPVETAITENLQAYKAIRLPA